MLTEDITFVEMFKERQYPLFGRDNLEALFAGWQIWLSRRGDCDTTGGALLALSNVFALKTGSGTR